MKKTLTIVMAMVLVAAVAITGTLAYMSAQSGSVTNTFKFGSITIDLDESKVDENGQIITGGGAMRVKANTYNVAPGATVDKDPTVHVQGSEKCYVYVSVQNNMLIDGKEVASYTPNAGWTKIGENAANHTVVYKYNNVVDASSATQDLTPVFSQVTFDGNDITLDNVGQLNDKTIVINAYAHQSENIGADTSVADNAALDHFNATAITVIG